MTSKMILIFLAFTTMSMSHAQTFQYSRGWTNGKRAGRPQVLQAEVTNDFVVPSASMGSEVGRSQEIEFPTPCQLQKLKMLLRGASTDQLYFLPCDVITGSTPSGGVAPLPGYSAFGPFRRSLALDHRNN